MTGFDTSREFDVSLILCKAVSVGVFKDKQFFDVMSATSIEQVLAP